MPRKIYSGVTIEPYSCGHTACKDYWLVGVGKFNQGSGFTKREATRIASLINNDDGFESFVSRDKDA